MVTRRWAAALMQLTLDLSYVFESSRRASIVMPYQQVQVKGDNFVLPILQRAHQIVLQLSGNIPSLMPVEHAIGEWIPYLDKKYSEQLIFLGAPFHLDVGDGRKLHKDSQGWILEVLKGYSESGTVTITEEGIGKLLTSEFMGKLDPMTRDDLNDGVSCILHLIPTPGAMILLRVAENAVRKYSERLTGKATDSSWGDIMNELEKNPRIKKSIVGYLQYLKDMRNEAQHPDRRFTQEEAERLLVQVKGLLDELRNK